MTSVLQLRKKYLGHSPALDADLLLAHAIKKPKEFILTHPEYKLTARETLRFFYAFFCYQRGYPLAYITGHKEFFGLNFFVDKRVLVPRPETELLVEEALKIVNLNSAALLIDIGTGSGCIPIAIAKNCQNKNLKIIATDISISALSVAQKNARTHNVSIDFFHGSTLAPLLARPTLLETNTELIITANLPYGWKAWKNNSSMETKRLQREPGIALFTGENGLALYRKLLTECQRLTQPFTLLMEFDPRQTVAFTKLIITILPTAQLEIKKDLAGRDRLAIAQIN